jgi:hypothetical protein
MESGISAVRSVCVTGDRYDELELEEEEFHGGSDGRRRDVVLA